jgi:hypothetical protein
MAAIERTQPARRRIVRRSTTCSSKVWLPARSGEYSEESWLITEWEDHLGWV